MPYIHASARVKFACIVRTIIFVWSYSRPLTLRVCLEGDGRERMERVQESSEQAERVKKERRPVRQAEQRGGEDRQEIKRSPEDGTDETV